MSGFEIAETTPDATAEEDISKPLPNEGPHSTFVRQVKKLGRDAALGRDSLPALVAAIAEAVETNALDPAPPKDGRYQVNGKPVSPAVYVFDIYMKEDGRKAVHDRSKKSNTAQASKIKQIIDACAKPNVNFREALVRAADARKGLFQQEAKLKPAFDSYLDMARAQIKKDSSLTDEEVEFFQHKKDVTRESNISKELEKAWRVLEKLLTGEGKSGVILPTADPRYDGVQSAYDNLLEAIRSEKPDFNVPKAPEAVEGEEEESEEVEGEEEEVELDGMGNPVDGGPPVEEPAVQPQVQAAE